MIYFVNTKHAPCGKLVSMPNLATLCHEHKCDKCSTYLEHLLIGAHAGKLCTHPDGLEARLDHVWPTAMNDIHRDVGENFLTLRPPPSACVDSSFSLFSLLLSHLSVLLCSTLSPHTPQTYCSPNYKPSKSRRLTERWLECLHAAAAVQRCQLAGLQSKPH